jgi:hypothetical protein
MVKRVVTPVREEPEPQAMTDEAEINETQSSLQEAASSARTTVAAAPAQGGDTLLSTPAAADHTDAEVVRRVEELEGQLTELGARVRLLEKQKAGPSGMLPWLAVLLFFVVLAVTWQLLSALR